MAPYLELVPPPQLAESVECFWTMQSEESFPHRVLPDGCADIIFTRDSGKASLTVVGTMTRFADFQIPPRQLLVGVRFRPGMWREHFGVPSPEITDGLLSLEELWGAPGEPYCDRWRMLTPRCAVPNCWAELCGRRQPGRRCSAP